MIPLARGMFYVDDDFLGIPRLIATAVIVGTDGIGLVDPGPSTSLPALRAALARAGIRLSDVTDLIVTHIHLDHAGACGTIARESPRVRVVVHERGAPHLADPSKLLASATRLYGADMERLWGEVLPVAQDRIAVLSGGEQIRVGGRTLDVEYTPGHASHHVSYFNDETGIAFVGDTAGVRLETRPATANGTGLGDAYILPPTPPPDIDLEAWNESLQRIDRWKPSTLFLTHFGPHSDPESHLSELRKELAYVAELARLSLARDEPDEARETWFVNELRLRLRRKMGDARADAYNLAGRLDLCWKGLARYWRKREICN